MRQNCSKVVVENFFEPCILFLLLQKPSYGYELKTNLDCNCSCSVNIGNLYRCLSRLQKDGHIVKKKMESKIGPDKLMYEITDSGKKLLAEWIAELELHKNKISQLIINYKKIA
jgi:PadR family transcriptional regulator, regulatory protein PadR